MPWIIPAPMQVVPSGKELWKATKSPAPGMDGNSISRPEPAGKIPARVGMSNDMRCELSTGLSR